jgi:hypothetical protein
VVIKRGSRVPLIRSLEWKNKNSFYADDCDVECRLGDPPFNAGTDEGTTFCERREVAKKTKERKETKIIISMANRIQVCPSHGPLTNTHSYTLIIRILHMKGI